MQFFFYGTLMNADRLQSVLQGAEARSVGAGSVVGTLYDLGEYPGLILGGPATVPGFLFDVDEADATRLDDYEGVGEGLYARRLIQVTTCAKAANLVDAWTYEYLGPVENLRPIARWHGPQRP